MRRVPTPLTRQVALLATAIFVAALAAAADETLPRGLIRQGGVVMMQPIGEGGEPNGGPSNNEHRPGNVHVLSAADRDLYIRAFQAADRGDLVAARGLADQGHDPIARKLLEWRRLLDKNSGASFADIDAFLKSNPDWPLHETLCARAEAAIGPDLSPAGVTV